MAAKRKYVDFIEKAASLKEPGDGFAVLLEAGDDPAKAQRRLTMVIARYGLQRLVPRGTTIRKSVSPSGKTIRVELVRVGA